MWLLNKALQWQGFAIARLRRSLHRKSDFGIVFVISIFMLIQGSDSERPDTKEFLLAFYATLDLPMLCT